MGLAAGMIERRGWDKWMNGREQEPGQGRHGVTRRSLLAGGAAACFAAPHARAADGRIRMLTNWFAQAEHGGFYQALATGLYARAGLSVTIEPGGPQINNAQILAAGGTDFAITTDLGTLQGVQRGLPNVVVATSFQFDPIGILVHDDVHDLAGLKNHRILIANAQLPVVWATLQRRYGLAPDQVAPYTFNLQPFFLDRNVAIQSYVTSEPFEVKRAGVPYNMLLLRDAGIPGYGNPIATTRAMLQASPDVVAAFLKASMQGWRDYLVDPEPANRLIIAANPRMDPARIAFAIEQIKALQLLTGGDAATGGIGTITEARWKRDDEFLVGLGMLDRATDWRQGFDTRFIDAARILPA